MPPRQGLTPARLKLPAQGPWSTLREHLVERLHMLPPDRIDAMLREHEFVGVDGPFGLDSPFVPNAFVWFHRDLPEETPVPFDIGIVHRDDTLVVVDKPHFMATTPRGRHVMQTVLVRLRHELGLPALSPAHRLDRPTAGLVMFVISPEHRGAYQNLFQDRKVVKEYQAVAPFDPDLPLPRTVRNRLIKERGVLTAQEVPGEPNSETSISLLERRGDLGKYRLVPMTGRTHQLRVHMCGLGIPILGDDLYPTVVNRAQDDFTRPLQLLATALEFTDPLTGRIRRFESARTLQAWSGYEAWRSASLVE